MRDSDHLDSLMMRADIANKEARERGNMSKHTVGPWAASGPRIFSYQHDAKGLDKGVLAECFTQYSVADAVISDEEVEANALLMSRAPELLSLAREATKTSELVKALLCTPGEASPEELVFMITDLGTRAAALINKATKEEI